VLQCVREKGETSEELAVNAGKHFELRDQVDVDKKGTNDSSVDLFMGDTIEEAASTCNNDAEQPVVTGTDRLSEDNCTQQLPLRTSHSDIENCAVEQLRSHSLSDYDALADRTQTPIVSYNCSNISYTSASSGEDVCANTLAGIPEMQPLAEKNFCGGVSSIFGVSPPHSDVVLKSELLGSVLQVCHGCPTI